MEPNYFLYLSIISLLTFFGAVLTLMILQFYWQVMLCIGIAVFIGIIYSIQINWRKNQTRVQPTIHHVPQNQIKIIRPGIKSKDINIETKSDFDSKTETKKLETKD
jgi:5-bromo-4-chloroindolyl phosphate hydrolysis protein